MDGGMRDASVTRNEHRKLGLGWTAGADSIINCSERKACFFSSHGIREQDTSAANLTIEICPHRIANSPWLAFKCSWLNYNSIQSLIHTCGLHIILQTGHCTASLSMSLPSFQLQREGWGRGRERRTESLSSLQLLLRILVWFSLLLRIYFHNRQQVGAVSAGLADSGGHSGHSSGQPCGSSTPLQGASLQLGAILLSCAVRKSFDTSSSQYPHRSSRAGAGVSLWKMRRLAGCWFSQVFWWC